MLLLNSAKTKGREYLGLIGVRGLERPREVLAPVDHRDQEPSAPVSGRANSRATFVEEERGWFMSLTPSL